MTGQKLAADQELIAQGVGNLVLPFFGGVPATAAIARMSVGVKAGGVTRMVSFVQSGALLISALFLGGMIGDIPLAALSGVLLVTAVRMNEWHLIRFYVRRRLKSPVAIMIVTMLATITFDLTRAILIGLAVSLLIFVAQAFQAGISLRDLHRLTIVSGAATQPDMALFTTGLHHATPTRHHEIQVVLMRGPLSFLTAEQVATQVEHLGQPLALILALGGVPLIDASGIAAIERTWVAQGKAGHRLYLAQLQPRVHRLMERAGLLDEIGRDSVVPTVAEAIHLAHRHLTDIPSARLTAELNEYDSDLPFGVVPVNSP
jgi:SulP family sulfate permease